MLKFLKKEANKTLTENGAAAYMSTQSDCLDLFATIGALRQATVADIAARFDRAWAENPDIALKTLFYARDVRGGLGERHVFRVILRSMASGRTESVAKNMTAIPEFGRFDDLLTLLGTPAEHAALEYIREQFTRDMDALQSGEAVSLLGKWLPSINAHSPVTVRNGKIVAKALGLSEAQYRKSLTALRARIAIIENNLREADYTFDYAKQPSRAMFKYRKAFFRHDEARYNEFLSQVERGEASMHTGTLLPYDIIRPALEGMCGRAALTADERRAMDVTWNALPDFTSGDSALVVVDGSGSMYMQTQPRPAEVALSLGIYFAQRNTGRFRNHFITFSENPRMVELKGGDIVDTVAYAASFNEAANTNIQLVFELILNTAVKYRLPRSEMPSTLYFISDMEFDQCTSGADVTNFKHAQMLFKRRGYELPNVVFWNVSSRNDQQPVTMNEQGVALVSGASPRVFSMVTSGILSPYAFMMETLNVERYAGIAP